MDSPVPIKTLGDFREAIDSGRPLVITDKANGIRLHTDPDACLGVGEAAFKEKVLDNSGRNGAYFSVRDRDEALAEWPDLLVCRSPACGGG